jgi:hypothetical protein
VLLAINARDAAEVTVEVSEGHSLHWKFTSVDYDVEFGVNDVVHVLFVIGE